MLLRIKKVCEFTGLSRSTIYNLVGLREFPAPVKISKRCVAWHSDAVENWIKSKKELAGPRRGGKVNG